MHTSCISIQTKRQFRLPRGYVSTLIPTASTIRHAGLDLLTRNAYLNGVAGYFAPHGLSSAAGSSVPEGPSMQHLSSGMRKLYRHLVNRERPCAKFIPRRVCRVSEELG